MENNKLKLSIKTLQNIFSDTNEPEWYLNTRKLALYKSYTLPFPKLESMNLENWNLFNVDFSKLRIEENTTNNEDVLEKFNVNGLCHITGGGLYENVPRVLGEDVDAKIFEKNIPQKEIFTLLQKWGEISKEEMYGTFNMGIGMLIFVEKEDVDGIKSLFADMNEEIYEVGEVVEGNSKVILY